MATSTRVDVDFDTEFKTTGSAVKGKIRMGGKTFRVVSPNIVKMIDSVAIDDDATGVDAEAFWEQIMVYIHEADHAKFMEELRRKGITSDQLRLMIQKLAEIAGGDVPTKEGSSS